MPKVGGTGHGGAPSRPAGVGIRVALLAGVLAASAGGPLAAMTPAEYLARIDRDGDGRIDLAEFQAWMIRGFDRMDANGNGVLDIDEQPPGANRRPVSRTERLREIAAAFARQDRNGDGYLDAAELASPPR